MLVDLHLHTAPMSYCCRISAKETLQLAKACGFDGVAIANHYADYYFDDGYDEFVKRYEQEWENCKAIGDQLGLKVFCAIEVTMPTDPWLHMLIYGNTKHLLHQYPYLCNKSQQQLYEICDQNDCVLVQAHPFRQGTQIQNTRFLHGLEINCHPLYDNGHYQIMLDAAKKAGLAITVGSDFHGNDHPRPMGGVLLPDAIQTDADLAWFIKTSKHISLQVQYPLESPEIIPLTYHRD